MVSEKSVFDAGLVFGASIALGRIVFGEYESWNRIDVVGLGTMMVFRMFTKSGLLRVLPPAIRLAAKGFDLELTTRKHYKAAT